MSIGINENGDIEYKEASSHMTPREDELNQISHNIDNVSYTIAKYDHKSGAEMQRDSFNGIYKINQRDRKEQAIYDIIYMPDKIYGEKEAIRDLYKYDNCAVNQVFRTDELLGIAHVTVDAYKNTHGNISHEHEYGVYGVNGDNPTRLQYDLYNCYEKDGIVTDDYKKYTNNLSYQERYKIYNNLSINGQKCFVTSPDLLNESYIQDLEEKAKKVR